MAPRLKRISLHGRRKTPSARDVVFRELPGHLSFINAMATTGRTLTSIMHPPGLAGISTVCKDMSFYVSPWSGEDHVTLYEELTGVIDEVDPALVVLDVFFRPAIDATRKQNRLHAFITPNTVIESFPHEQPYLGWLWKYPVSSSDRKGLQTDASTPVDIIPPNVTCTGPISLSLLTAEEQSPGLARWLARSPTVLINLGNLFSWTEDHATAMAQAVAAVLHERTDMQVLWKFRKAVVDAEGAIYGDEFASPVHPFLKSGRVKMEPWLDVDPTSLLETGHIVASVHHGGAGCYHEALGTGVPQVVLPLWLDHYTFAQLVEDVRIGIWGCRETSPYWTADCLRHALLTVLDRSENGIAMRENARRFGDLSRRDPGQYVAAREIAKLAASGYGS
ncbi:hypothetical protein DL764_008613 [Monosporascus ibericus]|uniref:Erythromycin biosynthesis protein CIII-like C-terminal domain-containing protein n=1 Tax=Monosporascus ibericus TaxID=155417 RepID=A0A4Q4SX19_9PEZI|nr:hypothetical protein DL764_008613 [Monosporascus ibericus]